jgi:hypothetical protein
MATVQIRDTENLIGVSLSFCIRHILRGEVELDRVVKIIAQTTANTEEAWHHVLSEYKQSYWREFPEEAEKLVAQLRAEGRIEQPRLVDPNRMIRITKATGVWYTSEEDIIWEKAC